MNGRFLFRELNSDLDRQTAEGAVTVSHVPRAIRTLARILLGKMPDGTYQKALLHIQRAIQLQPSCMAAHFELAKTYDMMGEKAPAISGYYKVLEMPRLDHSDWKKQRSARQQLNRLTSTGEETALQGAIP